jgi:hypothetical protein
MPYPNAFQSANSVRSLQAVSTPWVQRFCVRGVFAATLLFTFWPVFRILNITVFDCLTPVAIVFGLSYLPKARGPGLKWFSLAIAGVGCLALAGVTSYPSSNDPTGHLLKVVNLVVALGGIVGLSYVLANRKIFSVVEAIVLLCLSATISSAVALLQGRFGMLRGIIPVIAEINISTRMTGLCEHPIEAGIAAAFGVILALGLAFHTRRWLACIPLMAVNLLSLMYSASLTAVIALVLGTLACCMYLRAYKFLIIAVIVGVTAITAALSYSGLGLLTSRLDTLMQAQGNYATVQSRELQWSKALELIGPTTLAVGNGYSAADIPLGMEIHNGLVAALFHFGVLGLVSQFLLIGFFVARMRHGAASELKATLLGCILIFSLAYLTGPSLSRRSIWVPLIILGAYLTRQVGVAHASTSASAGFLAGGDRPKATR